MWTINGPVKMLILAMGVPCLLYTQAPFDCSGRNFRVVEKDRGTMLQEILIDPVTKESTKLDLEYFEGVQINGICYRPIDNCIYGILLEEPYVLCRIDGHFNLERLAKLPLPTNFLFVAGDISPDGQHLVLLSSSRNEPTNLLAKVDLASNDYQTTITPMSISDEQEAIFCADIAFHPTTGILYGFNNTHDRIISIDLENKIIENELFPSQTILTGIVPSLFFDVSGDLMAVGTQTEFSRKRFLYRFDLEEGQVSLIEKYGAEGNQDACSCPYIVHVFNDVKGRSFYPCTEKLFEITLINRSPYEQKNIILKDTFPKGVTVSEVIGFPFENAKLAGLGTRILTIEGFDLPVGTFQFELKVAVDEYAQMGRYDNQVYLHNIDFAYNTASDWVASDDPKTTSKDDPTQFVIQNLGIDLGATVQSICSEEVLLLDPKIGGGAYYLWNTGLTTPTLSVDGPGYYEVTVTTACGQASGGVTVEEVAIDVDLGPDLIVEKGEEITMKPKVQTSASVGYFFWQHNLPEATLPCTT